MVPFNRVGSGSRQSNHGWAFLQRHDTEIAEQAARQNLRIWPLSTSYLGEARQGFILGFGSASVEDIPAAVRKLSKLPAKK